MITIKVRIDIIFMDREGIIICKGLVGIFRRVANLLLVDMSYITCGANKNENVESFAFKIIKNLKTVRAAHLTKHGTL